MCLDARGKSRTVPLAHVACQAFKTLSHTGRASWLCLASWASKFPDTHHDETSTLSQHGHAVMAVFL